MRIYLDLAREALTALTDAMFIFPALTYGMGLLAGAGLILTALFVLSTGKIHWMRWAAISVWLLVALSAGGALFIAGDALRAEMGSITDEHQKQTVQQHLTLLSWAWAAPLSVALLMLITAALKAGMVRMSLYALTLVLAMGSTWYALTYVYSYSLLDTKVDLHENWLDGARGDVQGDDRETQSDQNSVTRRTDEDSASPSEDNAPVRFFGIPID